MEYVRVISKVRLKQVKEGRIGFDVDQVNKPEDVYKAVRRYYQGADREMVGVLCLDAHNAPTCFSIVTMGSLNTTRTRPADILKLAILSNALSIILVHNHPSGTLEASSEDQEFTRNIKRACGTLDIDLYDHLIITDEGYSSLRELGLL